MRSELQLKERLEGELLLYAGFPSKMTDAARACHERISLLTWILEPTQPQTEPPKKANGSSDKLLAVRIPDDDDDGGDDD